MAGSSRGDTWIELAKIAERQQGVLSHAQLLEAGLSRSGISRAAKEGRVHRIFRGVYALGHAQIRERGRMRAAVLACGAGSVVSHRSAANLLGLVDRAPVVVDLIAPGSRGRELDGIKPHDVARPSRHETGTVEGIPCTSPARTLVDLAGVVGVRTLRSSFERAAVRRLLDIAAIEAALGAGGRRGMSDLQLLLEEWRAAAPVAMEQRLKSPLEAKILPLLRRRGIPAPRCNAPVTLIDGRIEVDFLWPQHRFVVEADSRDFHAPEVAFERDRWRDRELMRVSHGSLRVTSQQAEQEPEQVADAVARELARRQPDRAGSDEPASAGSG